jgi:N-acyl-D-amino-acid deacylase
VQADIFNFAGRGRLEPGAFADVVVFDPKTVAPGPVRRVRDFPADCERLTADQPVGMAHVLVNGVPIRVDGVPVSPEDHPGRLIAPSAR